MTSNDFWFPRLLVYDRIPVMSAKLSHHLTSSLLVCGLICSLVTGCDDLLNVEADPPKSEMASESESKPKRRSGRPTYRLVAEDGASGLPRGATTLDERLVEMDRLFLKVMSGDEVTGGGKVSITYKDSRKVDVISANIQRIQLDQAVVAYNMAMTGQDPIETVEPSPLQGQVLTADRGEVSMPGVPTVEQKKALAEYQGLWLGGNDLFPNYEVKSGDSWQVKPKLLLEAIFDSEFQKVSGKVDLIVKRRMNLDGHECAEISISLERCKGVTTSTDGSETELEMHGYGTLYRAIDIFHVLKADLSGDVVLTMDRSDGLTMRNSGGFEFTATSSVSRSE
jgi:hypothetical protein